MLTEGFDCPRLGRVWIDKSTDSLLLLVQCAGRALRAGPGKHAAVFCGSEDTAELLSAALSRCNRPPLALSCSSAPVHLLLPVEPQGYAQNRIS